MLKFVSELKNSIETQVSELKSTIESKCVLQWVDASEESIYLTLTARKTQQCRACTWFL